ncbi:hypothetical protein Tco_1415040, partial [Tanacetum coccineum]
DAEIQTRTSVDTEILLDQEEPTKLVKDFGSGERVKKRLVLLTYQLVLLVLVLLKQYLVLSFLKQEQAKSDLEKALELQKQLDEREEVVGEADLAQVIDLSYPAMLKFYVQQNRSFSKAESMGSNQSFIPKDSEIEKEVMIRSGFDFQKPPAKRQKIGEVSGSVEEQSAGKEK